VVGTLVEHRPLWDIFDVTRGSLNFTITDPYLWPLAFALLALGWRRLVYSRKEWYAGPMWAIASLLIGVLLGIGFHLYDRYAYSLEQWLSPTKLLHDLGAWGMLGAGLAYAWPRVLANKKSRPYGWAVLGIVVIFVVLVVVDTFIRPRDTMFMHPPYCCWPE
jgi:hypothetical protein